MAEVDTSIYGPLIQQNQPFDVQNFLKASQMGREMRQQQAQTQTQNALAQLMGSPSSYDDKGNLTRAATLSMNSLSPQFAMQYRDQEIEAHFKQVQTEAATDEIKRSALNFKASVAAASEQAREDKIKAGATDEDADRAATEVRNQLYKDSGGLIREDEVNAVLSRPYDRQVAAYLKRLAPGEIQAERLAAQEKRQDAQTEIAKQNADTASRRADNQATEIAALVARMGRDGRGKPPAGYEWDPQNPDTARPIKGGPKDPDAIKPWAGREKVYTERILGSANQAATAIQNITELPVSSSTGLLGIGGHQGGSLFSASFGALKNKLSDQDVQDYNVMLAGVKRNLAAIETMGLAPAGALTESMASLELRPGDSSTTKLRKLAEMRQIVEKGMDVPLADPAIPPEIKSLATKVVDTVTKAVPYTQADVTRLQREGEKNPDMTLEQLIRSRGLGGDRPSASTRPAADKSGAPKELKPGDKFTHPSGATVEILN